MDHGFNPEYFSQRTRIHKRYLSRIEEVKFEKIGFCGDNHAKTRSGKYSFAKKNVNSSATVKQILVLILS